jgi:hypothetical protein
MCDQIVTNRVESVLTITKKRGISDRPIIERVARAG